MRHETTSSPRTCNIDSRGRAVRLVSGILTVLVAIGLAIALLAGYLTSPAWWALALGALIGGAFQIYEGWAGWCALRAMGIRTPF
ncbi:MAG: hypothetical protein WD079_04855 [Phycisphaeraceae bacterium]